MDPADFDVGDEDEDVGAVAAPSTALEDDRAAGEGNVRWPRPEVAAGFAPATHSLAFQWTSVDLMSGDPLPAHPRGGGLTVPGAPVGPVPIIR